MYVAEERMCREFGSSILADFYILLCSTARTLETFMNGCGHVLLNTTYSVVRVEGGEESPGGLCNEVGEVSVKRTRN